MNAKEIIKNIEAEQLKAEVPEFNVEDTVRVHAKRFSRVPCSRSRAEATVRRLR